MKHVWLLSLFLPIYGQDLRGIWKAEGNAHLNVESAITVPSDHKLPYTKDALALVGKNFAQRAKADPESKCFQPGVPRANYLPYPFQILQNDRAVYIVYQRVHAYRILYLDNAKHSDGLGYSMGDSRAHWEGETLVADVNSFNDLTWFDAAGHHHSDQLHVTERYSRTSPETIRYEATVDDPGVFSKPWTLSVNLRRQHGAELEEDECVEDDAGNRRHVRPYKTGR
jgi:hypothetical protein